MPREIRLPMLRAQTSVAPETLDVEARTVEVRFYSGASVQRFPFFDDPYELTFSLNKGAVRLERFNAGAPLVDNHLAYGSVGDVVLGVVEKAWLADDGGHARVKIAADRPDIVARVKDGILRNFSMGAVIHQMRDITEKGDKQKRLLAIDWEPHELSLVPVGADPGAQALADQQPETFRCELTIQSGEDAASKETKMSDQNPTIPVEPPKPDAPAPIVDLAAVKSEAIKLERERAAECRRMATLAGLGEVYGQKLVNDGTSVEDARKAIFEELAKKTPVIDNRIDVGQTFDSPAKILERMAVALTHRATPKLIELSEEARPYRGHSLIELAGELLRARGIPFDRTDKHQIVRLALSTSDYPSLLENVANKILIPQYDAAAPTYRSICSRQDLPDFKTTSFLKTGDFPAPLEVPEGGEIKFGYFSESKDTGALATYGRRVPFTRQAMINDDLGAFSRVLASWGPRVADFENATFFTLLSTVGPTLGDTGAMFNATAVTTAGGHANYTSSGTAIADTSINVGASQMAAQVGGGTTNLGDGIKLNIQPKFLLANPSKRLLSWQYTSAAYVPALPTSQNPFTFLMPLLDANVSGNRWWLFADPAIVANFVYGSLAGASGPRVETRQGFEVEGVELKLAFDFYVAGIDFRGGYCNAGA